MYTTFRNFLLISLALMLCYSCKKYDEDEKRSWKTPEARITKKWLLNLPGVGTSEYEFKKDGSFTNGGVNKINSWTLDSEKEHLIAMYENGNIQDFQIEQLEKEKMVLSYYSVGIKFTWFFEAVD